MKNLSYLSTMALAALLAFSSCKKDTKDPEPEPEPTPVIPITPSYTIPTTYNYTNTATGITTATNCIAMLGELTTYLKSTHTTTAATQPTISAQKLKDMYANANSQFTLAALNTCGINLKAKSGTALNYPTLLDASFDDAEPASITSAANPTTSTASSGVKGKLVSPARAILVNGNGFEYKEYAEKGLMGAVFYYQATTILSTIGALDNTTILNGTTAQEKAWDEAFGFFGVPVDFPTNLTGLKNWGSYCNSVNVAIGSNSLIMNAFLKGRAAIVNKDNTGRDEAKNAVINNWEKVVAAKCISYLKSAKNNLSDPATLHHNLSEGWGFVVAFQYNPNKTISNADITTLLNYFGTNLYNMPTANIDLAIAKLETVFGLNASLIP